MTTQAVSGAAAAFFVPVGDGRFAATRTHAGRGTRRIEHAGPPAALLGRALERCEPRDGMLLARLTFEILRPVPVAEVAVRARVVRPGRSVQLLEGELTADGEPVVTVRAWRVKAADAPTRGEGSGAPPRQAEATPPPPLEGFGYGDAVELRVRPPGAGSSRGRRPCGRACG